jgi:hypothetical protein
MNLMVPGEVPGRACETNDTVSCAGEMPTSFIRSIACLAMLGVEPNISKYVAISSYHMA